VEAEADEQEQTDRCRKSWNKGKTQETESETVELAIDSQGLRGFEDKFQTATTQAKRAAQAGRFAIWKLGAALKRRRGGFFRPLDKWPCGKV